MNFRFLSRTYYYVISLMIFGGAAFMLHNSTAAVTDHVDDSGLPMMTVPLMKTPPVVDGEINQDEWTGATAMTGFSEFNTGKLADRQTTVFIGYDKQNLYVAMRSPSAGEPRNNPHQNGFDFQADAVELWLAPPDKPWVHLLVGPQGRQLQANQTKNFAWKGKWQAATHAVDSGERVGGVLTFAKATWTVETAIPFASLGVSSPLDGQKWRINFTRDYAVAPGQDGRTSRDWTSWSRIKGSFNDVSQFGTAVFDSKTPAVGILSLGDLAQGDESMQGRAQGNGSDITLSLNLSSDNSKSLASVFKTIAASPAGAEFSLSKTVQLRRSEDMQANISAQDSAGNLLLRQKVLFHSQPPMGLSVVQNPAKDLLWAHIDTRRMADLPKTYQVNVTTFQGNQEMKATGQASWNGSREDDVELNTGSLLPGDYQVHAQLINPATKKEMAVSIVNFTKPAKPVWLGNKLGISRDVPAPWMPVQWDSSTQTVGVIQRTYQLNALGLPNQIMAIGKPTLQAPATLTAVVDGKKVQWKGTLQAPTEKADDRIVWPLHATAGALRLDGTLTIEFDGFAKWNVQISATHPIQLDQLYLNFPLLPKSSLYARGRDVTSDTWGSWYSAALYNPGPPKAIEIAGVNYSPSGWAWPDQWLQEIWVGGDLQGLSVMNETDQYRIGSKRTQIIQSDASRILRINLVSKPVTLNKPLPYDFAWQATPVKPAPKSFGPRTASYRSFDDPDYLNQAAITLDMWSLKHQSYPEFKTNKAAFQRHNKNLLDHGIKIVPYFGTDLITTDVPSLKPWLALWQCEPYRTINNPTGNSTFVDPQAASLRDYYAWAADQIFHKMDMGGLYLDVSGVVGNTNPYQDSGYTPFDGSPRRPTVDIFAQRDLYKRLYKIAKADGQDKVLFRHQQPIAAIAGFVDVTLQGEGWSQERKQEYDHITPDFFRANIMRRQAGTPHLWYTFFHYYRGKKYGRVVPLWEILAYCLPHHTLPSASDPGMWPVWSLFKNWWTDSKFTGYWQDGFPFRFQPGVLGAVYLKAEKGEALVVVANWNQKPEDVSLTIDPQQLGLPAGTVHVERALAHPIHADYEKAGNDPESPINVSGNQVRMQLQPRNLEVLHVTVQP